MQLKSISDDGHAGPLLQVGAPYQYGQDKAGQMLWAAKFVVLMALSKLLPWLFSPPIFRR